MIKRFRPTVVYPTKTVVTERALDLLALSRSDDAQRGDLKLILRSHIARTEGSDAVYANGAIIQSAVDTVAFWRTAGWRSLRGLEPFVHPATRLFLENVDSNPRTSPRTAKVILMLADQELVRRIRLAIDGGPLIASQARWCSRLVAGEPQSADEINFINYMDSVIGDPNVN